MSANPMNIPPGGGPSLEPEPGKPWYTSKTLWAVAAIVALGALSHLR